VAHRFSHESRVSPRAPRVAMATRSSPKSHAVPCEAKNVFIEVEESYEDLDDVLPPKRQTLEPTPASRLWSDIEDAVSSTASGDEGHSCRDSEVSGTTAEGRNGADAQCEPAAAAAECQVTPTSPVAVFVPVPVMAGGVPELPAEWSMTNSVMMHNVPFEYTQGMLFHDLTEAGLLHTLLSMEMVEKSDEGCHSVDAIIAFATPAHAFMFKLFFEGRPTYYGMTESISVSPYHRKMFTGSYSHAGLDAPMMPSRGSRRIGRPNHRIRGTGSLIDIAKQRTDYVPDYVHRNADACQQGSSAAAWTAWARARKQARRTERAGVVVRSAVRCGRQTSNSASSAGSPFRASDGSSGCGTLARSTVVGLCNALQWEAACSRASFRPTTTVAFQRP